MFDTFTEIAASTDGLRGVVGTRFPSRLSFPEDGDSGGVFEVDACSLSPWVTSVARGNMSAIVLSLLM
jgi:hypothetical protein